MEYDLLPSGATSYADFRLNLMNDLWGAHDRPYVDKSGVPRIGPNVDLSFYLGEVVEAIMGVHYDEDLVFLLMDEVNKSYDNGDTDLLRKRLDDVMRDWAQGHDLPDRFTTFRFADDDQVKQVLDASLADAESWLPRESGIPDSEERAVLATVIDDGLESFQIDALVTAVLDGDRAEAWYLMRYESNGGGSEGPAPTAAIAGRRYLQSKVFELYDDPDQDIGFAEAEAVGRMYSDNREWIVEYENRYAPKGATIVDFLQPAVQGIADFYHIAVGRMEEILFADGRAAFFGDDLPDGLNSKKNDDDLIIGTDGIDDIDGGAGNDTILGDTGPNSDSQADFLKGGAGNDRLYGGGDVDKLVGGAGDDVLWGGGDANDVLEGGKGNDTYYLTDDASTEVGGTGGTPDPSLVGGSNDDVIQEAGRKGGTDTVVVWVSAGEFDLKNIEKFRLAADISGNVTVLLNQFDDFVLSTGNDDLTLTINKLQKTPIDIRTNGGADTISIEFEPGVDPSQVLDGKGLTARFRFSDLTANDTIDLTSIGIEDIVMKRDQITEDKGFYLMAPGAKLDLMEHGKIDKTYNNSTDSWFVVKCGDDTPYGPEFIGHIDRSHFDI